MARKRMENHCISLLSYVAEHPNEEQSLEHLSDKCGIPVNTLKVLLHTHRVHGDRACYLCITATKYRYDFKTYPEYHRRQIDAVRRGYT